MPCRLGQAGEDVAISTTLATTPLSIEEIVWHIPNVHGKRVLLVCRGVVAGMSARRINGLRR